MHAPRRYPQHIRTRRRTGVMKWNEQYEATDEQLGMKDADPQDDLRLLLDDFGREALERTWQALRDGKFIRRTYRSGERGCLLYWLTGGLEGGVQHRRELLAYDFTTEAAGWAARRVVRWVDYQRLSDEEILRALDAALAGREK